MTAIWHSGGDGWRLLEPTGFADEATLHSLVEDSPQILPLADSPRLVVLGREVSLGGNLADLIAVEPSGRLCVIEIKLARNSEARRAIVAQVLTYAAYLKGLTVEELETVVLARHLAQRGFGSVTDAVKQSEQQGEYDPATFVDALATSLESGHFRLVLVLDSAPQELVRLCGYLQSVTAGLLLDLVAVSAYDANGERIMVPQRVDWAREPPLNLTSGSARVSPPKGILSPGTEGFESAIATAAADRQPVLRELVRWAVELEVEGLVTLESYQGKDQTTLLPRLAGGRGLITITIPWRPIQIWRSVWERQAPEQLAQVELLLGVPVGQGTRHDASPELLGLVHEAYRVAARGKDAISASAALSR